MPTRLKYYILPFLRAPETLRTIKRYANHAMARPAVIPSAAIKTEARLVVEKSDRAPVMLVIKVLKPVLASATIGIQHTPFLYNALGLNQSDFSFIKKKPF